MLTTSFLQSCSHQGWQSLAMGRATTPTPGPAPALLGAGEGKGDSLPRRKAHPAPDHSAGRISPLVPSPALLTHSSGAKWGRTCRGHHQHKEHGKQVHQQDIATLAARPQADSLQEGRVWPPARHAGTRYSTPRGCSPTSRKRQDQQGSWQRDREERAVEPQWHTQEDGVSFLGTMLPNRCPLYQASVSPQALYSPLLLCLQTDS